MPRSLRVSFWMAMVFTFLQATSALPAEPPAQPEAALPKDGAWARYHLAIKKDVADNVEDSEKITFAFVGSETHDGEKCRWIEVTTTHQSVQCLVSETALRESERPFDQVVKCRIRGRPGDVIEAGPKEAHWVGWFAIFLPGMLKAGKPLNEPQRVQYQQGNIDIEKGLSGRFVPNPDEPRAIVEYSVWMHSDVQAGFAYARVKQLFVDADSSQLTGDFEFLLEDVGADAKPSF